MSFASDAYKAGRQPVVIVEMDIDYCSLSFGVFPCTAAAPAGSECYNTRPLCQALGAYSGQFPNQKTYRFCLASQELPEGIDAYPMIAGDPQFQPAAINPGGGLGVFGGVTIKFRDDTRGDADNDPYYATRASAATGTWWGKFLNRNPYYFGRPLRVYIGYRDGVFPTDYQLRQYVIEHIDGPGDDGMVTLKGKDPLRLSDDKRAKVPQIVSAPLQSGITDSDTFLVAEGLGFEPALGLIRIEDELIVYAVAVAGASSTSFFGCVRASWKTDAAAHDEGASVQQAKRLPTQTVSDMVWFLLSQFTDIDPAFISLSNFDPEKWLGNIMVATVLVEPVSVRQLITELSKLCPFAVWWDEIDQTIRLRALAPVDPGTTVTEYNDDQIIENSVKIKRHEDQRISRVQIYYDQRSFIEGFQPDNFLQHYIKVGEGESPELYGQKAELSIESRWFDSEDRASIVTAVGRYMRRYGDPPFQVGFDIDAREVGAKTGDHITVTTRGIQDETGAPLPITAQILSVVAIKPGSQYRIEALALGFSGRYAYIAPDVTNDYPLASQSDKNLYGFIGPSSGLFGDGGEVYKII